MVGRWVEGWEALEYQWSEACSQSQQTLETQLLDKLTPGTSPFRCLAVSAGTVISAPHTYFLEEKPIATCLLSPLPLKCIQGNFSPNLCFLVHTPLQWPSLLPVLGHIRKWSWALCIFTCSSFFLQRNPDPVFLRGIFTVSVSASSPFPQASLATSLPVNKVCFVLFSRVGTFLSPKHSSLWPVLPVGKAASPHPWMEQVRSKIYMMT